MWQQKGKDACGDLLKEEEKALKRAKEREAAETRLRIMEARRDKLIVLADVVQDKAEERSRDKLIYLGNKVLYKKENMLSITQMLQGTNDPVIAFRAQKALDEATEAVGNSCACPACL